MADLIKIELNFKFFVKLNYSVLEGTKFNNYNYFQ